jgi:hypothetical protein
VSVRSQIQTWYEEVAAIDHGILPIVQVSVEIVGCDIVIISDSGAN